MQPPLAPSAGRPINPPQPARPGFPPQGAPPSSTAPASVAQPPQPGAAPRSASMHPGYSPQPNAPMRPGMRPAPGPHPTRPLPPQFSPNHPQNGAAPYYQQGGTPPAPHEQPQQQQQQLATSMIPRPFNDRCGKPRPFFHRGGGSVADERGVPTIPKSNSDYISVDDGNASIRYMRMTANTIAADPNVMTKSGVPLALVMTPFANPVSGESPIPVIDFSDKQVGGPLRCERCNGYANPGFKFINGGAQFQCNLCTHINNTPAEHFSPVAGHGGQRMDGDQRHELRMGSVEYIVGSPDYCIRPPRPPCYLFCVDVSIGSVQSGLAHAAMMSIKAAIGAGLLPGSGEGARVGVMTFDRNLHFFDARGANTGKPVTMQFVPDVMDPFVPIGGDGLFLEPAEAVAAVESAIQMHGLAGRPNKNEAPGALGEHTAESALGSTLQVVKQAFADCGGKAYVISASLPTAGVSKLERRGGGATGGGEEREIGLLKEANSDYDILGCELAEVQASVDLFLAPSSVYIDAATLSRLPRACGGRMYLFSGFNAVRDGASLHRSLCTAASEPRAFEALLRVRTSPGIEARGEFVGHFGRPQRGDDVSGPVFDASATLGLELSVTSKLLDDSNSQNRGYSGSTLLYDDVCLQCAILFTDCAGRRRIRVHTVFSKKTTVLSEVFSNTDVDATGAFLAKKAASAVMMGGSSFTKAWEALTERTAQMFYVYRKHCTTSSLNGQLILPESLKTLPVMMLGLIKSAAFRKPAASMQSGDAVTVDERAATLSHIISGTPAEIAVLCYPRMWEIQKLPDEAGIPLPPPSDPVVTTGLENGHKPSKTTEPISLPPTVMLSAESLTDDRILLIENGMQLVVWLGAAVDRAVAESIIVTGPGHLLMIRAETAASEELTKDVNEHGKKVAQIVKRIVSERKSLSRPQVVVRSEAGVGGEAKWLMPLLVEDRAGGGTHSYVEYLRHVHKRVMDKMASDSAQSDMQTWEMLNHGY